MEREIYVTIDKQGRCVIPYQDREHTNMRPGSKVTIRIVEVDGKRIQQGDETTWQQTGGQATDVPYRERMFR